MDSSESMKQLLSALTKDIGDEELLLSTLQSLIASEITGFRIKHSMTQSALAQFLGVSQGMLSKWESGECNFRLSTLVSIATKLGIEMQSPFVPAIPKAYHSTFSNITKFPPISWSSNSYIEKNSFSIATTDEQDLIEM